MIPLSPINLLTLKSRVLMPPIGDFTAPDIYCGKHWRRVQHISDEFWSRCRKEVLATLQCQQKLNTIRRNCKVGDIVLLKEAAAERNSWPMAKIVATNIDENGFVRSVKLMLGTSGTTNMVLRYLEQPVNKLVMLVKNEWLRWYSWAMCRRDIGIKIFTVVNSWLRSLGNFTCVNLRATHLFCTLYSLIFFIVIDTCFERFEIFSSLIDLYLFLIGIDHCEEKLTLWYIVKCDSTEWLNSGVSEGVRGVRTHPPPNIKCPFLNVQCPFLPINSF